MTIIDCRKSPEMHRGITIQKIVLLRYWESLTKDELDYLINWYIKPATFRSRAQIIFSTPLIEALL